MQLAIQLYTLRDLDESLPDTLDRVSDTVFEGVQFSRLGSTPPADLIDTADKLDSTGLASVGAHVGLDTLEESYEEAIATYDALRCDQLVVPSYYSEAFTSESSARNAGQRLSELSTQVADDGFGLHYHNHTFEFVELGPRTAFDIFAEEADGVSLEVDTGLANHAGADPVELLDRYGDRVSLVHLTDSRSGSDDTLHVDLGDGEVDLEGCVDAARRNDVDWLIFEHGQTADPLASMEHADEVLQGMVHE